MNNDKNNHIVLLDIIKKYNCDEENIEYILQETQNLYGYIPMRVQKIIAGKLSIDMCDLYRYIVDYNFLLEPKTQNTIYVCFGRRCSSAKSLDIYNFIIEELKIDGNISADGKFYLNTKRCFGSCGKAPVISINNDVYTNVDIDDIKGILKKYTL